MERKNGAPVLLDPNYRKGAVGGLYVEFSGGVRNARLLSWISEIIEKENDVVVIKLSPAPIVRRGMDWSRDESMKIVEIKASLPIDHFLLLGGAERHFAPEHANHFSIYNRDLLINTEAGHDPLEVYGKKLVGGFLITQR